MNISRPDWLKSLSPLFSFSILLLKTLHPFFSFFWNDFLVAIAFRFLLTLNKPTIEKLYQLKTSPLFISSEDKFKDLIFHWVKKIDIILTTPVCHRSARGGQLVFNARAGYSVSYQFSPIKVGDNASCERPPINFLKIKIKQLRLCDSTTLRKPLGLLRKPLRLHRKPLRLLSLVK